MDDHRFDHDFSLALWVQVPVHRTGTAGALASKFDASTRTGFTLAAIASAGGYNGPGDELRLSFGIDAGTEPRWEDCGRPSTSSNHVTALTVFEGRLYCGNNDARTEADYAHVFRHIGGSTWEDLGQVATDGSRGIGPLIVHGGALYAAAWNHDWTRVTYHNLRPCHVFRFDGPGRWIDCGQPGESRRIFSMASYRGDLYAIGDDFTIHVHRGDGHWEQVERLSTFGHPVTVFNDRLIVGTWEHPPTVLEYDGTDWNDLGNPLADPSRASQIHSLTVFGDALHVGSWPLGNVSKWDPIQHAWQDLGRLGDSTEINALTAYNGKLYAGSLPRAEVFRYEGRQSWSSIRRFREDPGWEPVSVADMERPPDGDLRMREWGRVTSLTEHEGRLFASVTSCTGSVIDAPPDVRGSVQALRAGAVLTSQRVLSAGWHHVVAVRTSDRLSLIVDGQDVSQTEVRLSASIATDAPLLVADGPTGHFRGRVEGLAVFDHAITAHEAALLLARRPD